MKNYLLHIVAVTLVTALLVGGCTAVNAAQVAPAAVPRAAAQQAVATPPPLLVPTPQPEAPAIPTRVLDPRLDGLWMDMSMGSQLVDLFNQYAGPEDIARADHVSLVDLLDRVKVGKRLVVFKNAADAEELVPRMADKIDIIGYNLESGPANRPDEQNDPIGSIRRVRALADQYDMQLAFGPDRFFALNYGVEMAPYADIFVLQVQRVQDEPATVRDFVLPLVAQLKRVNPALQVSVQVRTEGDMAAVTELVASLRDSIDGVSILTNDETSAVARTLMDDLRNLPAAPTALPEAPAEVPAPLPMTPPVKATGPVALLEPPTPPARRATTATVEAVVPPATLPVRSMLLLAGLSVMGVLLSGVVVTVILYSVRSLRRGR
jgi:hypothetical protein